MPSRTAGSSSPVVFGETREGRAGTSRNRHWHGIDLGHLRTFETVCRIGSFSGAARSLGYTQPAVSHQIASLERLLAVRLLDRTRGARTVHLPACGQSFLQAATRILATLAGAHADMSRASGAAPLRLEAFRSAATRLGATLVSGLRAAGVRVEVSASITDRDWLRSLRVGESDFALTTEYAVDDAVSSLHVVDDPWVLQVRRADLDALQARAAANRPIPIATLASPNRRGVVPNLSARHGSRCRIVLRSEDAATLRSAAEEGIAHALVPLLDALPSPLLEPIHVRGIRPRPLVVSWRSDRSLVRDSETLPAIRNSIRDAYAQLVLDAGAPTR